MPRFGVGQEDNYGVTNNGGGYFSLKEDGEVKKVRFLYKDSNDIAGYAVHEVMVDGKKRYVNCLREYGAPIDDCPLCKAGYKVLTKMYVPVYEEETGKVSLWERGKKFMSKMSSICARFPDVVSHVFEVERHGAKGATDTTYDIWEVANDTSTMEDFPEVPQILGKVILDKSSEEMKAYLAKGEFPNIGVPQREQARGVEPNGYNAIPQRRVPAGDERF